MNTRYFLRLAIWYLCSLPIAAIAQTPADSALLAGVSWHKEQIQLGLLWKKAHIDGLFDSKQSINLLEIDLSVPQRRIAFAGLADGLQLTSTFAAEASAQAAINATFFDMKNGGSTTFLKIDGKILNETSLLLPNGTNHERSNGALLIDDARATIMQGDGKTIGWDKQIAADNVMVCGPVLLLGGATVPLGQNAFNDNRHPRSAVGITNNGKIILITVDGRNTQAHGMSLPELAFILQQMGVQDALNLDGGGSTALYIQGKNNNGIVNYPSDNKEFDHNGERKVANAILVF